jgi:hypothetical protein
VKFFLHRSLIFAENIISSTPVVTDSEGISATQAGSSNIAQGGLSPLCSACISAKWLYCGQFFGGYEILRGPDSDVLMIAHGLPVNMDSSVEILRESISHHIDTGLRGSQSSRTCKGYDFACQGFNMFCDDEGPCFLWDSVFDSYVDDHTMTPCMVWNDFWRQMNEIKYDYDCRMRR